MKERERTEIPWTYNVSKGFRHDRYRKSERGTCQFGFTDLSRWSSRINSMLYTDFFLLRCYVEFFSLLNKFNPPKNTYLHSSASTCFVLEKNLPPSHLLNKRKFGTVSRPDFFAPLTRYLYSKKKLVGLYRRRSIIIFFPINLTRQKELVSFWSINLKRKRSRNIYRWKYILTYLLQRCKSHIAINLRKYSKLKNLTFSEK